MAGVRIVHRSPRSILKLDTNMDYKHDTNITPNCHRNATEAKSADRQSVSQSKDISSELESDPIAGGAETHADARQNDKAVSSTSSIVK